MSQGLISVINGRFSFPDAKKGCMCKVCDRELNDDMIVYLRSCRLHLQPYHICIPCWRKINALVEEELDNLGGENIGGKQ